MINSLDTTFSRFSRFGPLFIRFIIGWHLIYGTQDNILSWERMLEFRNFLEFHGLPFPLTGAIISVYAQFICGMFYIFGWFTRLAALIMIFNFIVALLLVHLSDPYPAVFLALMMLFGSLYLLVNGAGPISMDEKYRSNKHNG